MRRVWLVVTGVLTGVMLSHVLFDRINGATFLGMGALIYAAHKMRQAT